MKILFITAHPYLPQMRGGLQNSCNQLCHGLMERGHKVAILTALMPNGLLGWVSRIKMQINKILFGHRVSKDSALGYPVWRTWLPWETAKYVTEKEKPDIIVVMAVKSVRMAMAVKSTKIPVLMELQDVEFSKHDGAFEDLGKIPCVANSNFTAEKYHCAYGVVSTVIHPYISLSDYKTETTKENVTFINPVPEKGSDIALKIASLCPDIPFSFIEAWPLSREQRSELTQKLSALPNVTFLSAQKDMRKVYGKCKILLAPSMWEEGYGRVVTEAQMSGIPVVASTRGGLPEAVGPGGILLDPGEPIDAWVNAIRKLWGDDKYYADKSASARTYAQRPENSLEHKIELWEQVMQTVGNG